MTNLFRDRLYDNFPDPIRRLEVLEDALESLLDGGTTIPTKGELKIDDEKYRKRVPETDDTASFQRLFDDLGVEGDTAIITRGDYVINGVVTISKKDHFSIIGHKGAVVKRASVYKGNMFKLAECSDFMIKGLHIDSDDGFGTPAKVTGTYNADSKTYTVDSTAGYSNTGSFYIYTAAGIQSVTYTGKTSTSFTGCTNYGVIGGGQLSSPVTTGSEVRPIYSAPVALVGVSNFDITKNLFTGNYNHAASDMLSIEAIGDTTTTPQGYKTFVATVPTNNGRIYQNNFINSGEEAVIWRNGCTNIWANNNYFENIWGTGVTNKGNNSQVNYNVFKNCYIGTEVNAEAAIYTQGNDGTVRGNEFFNCGIPVFMQTTGTPLEAAGKFVKAYHVEDNSMFDSTFCAIYGRHGTQAIVRNNTIKGVTVVADPRTPPYGAGNGIYLFNVHRSEVENNKISNCANEHMWIDSCVDTKVNNNRTRQGGVFTKTTDVQNANATVYKVKSTTGYPDSGTFKVSIGGVEQTITYTGLTATSFTGCTGGDATAVPVDSFVRDVATKMHVYVNGCSNSEFTDNKIVNGYIKFHSADALNVVNTRVENTDATAAILVTGNTRKSRFNGSYITYARQYAIKLDGTGYTQDQNEVKNNKIHYASAAAQGGNSAIQIINNTNPVVNDNFSFTDWTNKPTYCVEFMNSVTGGTALYNIAIGFSASVPNKDWNTTTPNRMLSKETSGTETYSANGTLSSRQFEHKLNPSTPTSYDVRAISADAGAATINYFTADATYIYVYFKNPPVAGTNNVSLKWEASI